MAVKAKKAPAKKPAAKAAGKVAILTTKQLAANLAEKHELTKVQGNEIVSGVFDSIAKELKESI